MEKQANSRACFVCGVENPIGLHLKFYSSGPGEIQASLTAPEAYQGYPGILHGGVAAAILDETAGRALIDTDPPRFMFTAKMEIRYRKNVPIGKPLHIVGKAGRNRGRAAESWAGIYDQAGALLAEANVLLVDLPTPPDANALRSFGWKVYPDP
jgi:acyl-coenzyme A thioesterase PaaI-like protein